MFNVFQDFEIDFFSEFGYLCSPILAVGQRDQASHSQKYHKVSLQPHFGGGVDVRDRVEWIRATIAGFFFGVAYQCTLSPRDKQIPRLLLNQSLSCSPGDKSCCGPRAECVLF